MRVLVRALGVPVRWDRLCVVCYYCFFAFTFVLLLLARSRRLAHDVVARDCVHFVSPVGSVKAWL